MENNFYRDADAMHLFTHLILKACHRDSEFMFNGQIVKLKRGQLLTGRKILSAETGISEQSIRTRLTFFEKSDPPMIAIHSTNKYSVVTLCNYETYQNQNDVANQRDNQQITNKQPTDNQQITTYNNVKKDKNVKNDKNKDKIEQIILHLNSQAGTNFKPGTPATIKSINARLADGYSVDDFKDVISKKCREWMGTEWQKYLCPGTLFRPSNFEKYINQRTPEIEKDKKDMKSKKEMGKFWDEYKHKHGIEE